MMKTLSETMESLVRRGFTEHFGVRGDQLRGFESSKTFNSNEVTIREYDRFEGVSDPDDMPILYALESASGIRGTLVDAFGVYATTVSISWRADRWMTSSISRRITSEFCRRQLRDCREGSR